MVWAKFLVLIVSATLFLHCSETEFGAGESSGSGDGSTEDPPPTEDPTPTDPTPSGDDCIEGDSINLKFPPEIESCHAEGNLFNFEKNTCTNVRNADFACDWDTLISEMKSIGTSSQKVNNGQANGNKLVGCGASKAGDVIVAQWYDAEKSDTGNCEYGKGKLLIVTGCYGNLPEVDDSLGGQDQTDQVVASCLQNLSE